MVGWSSNNFFTAWTCHCPPWSSFELGQACELQRLRGPLIYSTIAASGCRVELSSCTWCEPWSSGAHSTGSVCQACISRLSLASFCSLKSIICKNKLLKEWFPPSCLPIVLFIPVLWIFFDFFVVLSVWRCCKLHNQLLLRAVSVSTASGEPSDPAVTWALLECLSLSSGLFYNFLLKSGFSFPIFELDLQDGNKKRVQNVTTVLFLFFKIIARKGNVSC